MHALKKGEAVRILPSMPGQDPLHGVAGIVTGFRPDGLVVVRLASGARAPFRREELERVA